MRIHPDTHPGFACVMFSKRGRIRRRERDMQTEEPQEEKKKVKGDARGCSKGRERESGTKVQ